MLCLGRNLGDGFSHNEAQPLLLMSREYNALLVRPSFQQQLASLAEQADLSSIITKPVFGVSD